VTDITRVASASIDISTAMFAPQISGLVAGEDLDAVAPCYIKPGDGKVWEANGSADNDAAEVVGFTARAVDAGEPVTLFGAGARFKFGSGLTIGAIYFLSTNKGELQTTASTGDSTGVAKAITATDIVVIRANGIGG